MWIRIVACLKQYRCRSKSSDILLTTGTLEIGVSEMEFQDSGDRQCLIKISETWMFWF
jgi:hypothetical protein